MANSSMDPTNLILQSKIANNNINTKMQTPINEPSPRGSPNLLNQKSLVIQINSNEAGANKSNHMDGISSLGGEEMRNQIQVHSEEPQSIEQLDNR